MELEQQVLVGLNAQASHIVGQMILEHMRNDEAKNSSQNQEAGHSDNRPGGERPLYCCRSNCHEQRDKEPNRKAGGNDVANLYDSKGGLNLVHSFLVCVLEATKTFVGRAVNVNIAGGSVNRGAVIRDGVPEAVNGFAAAVPVSASTSGLLYPVVAASTFIPDNMGVAAGRDCAPTHRFACEGRLSAGPHQA